MCRVRPQDSLKTFEETVFSFVQGVLPVYYVHRGATRPFRTQDEFRPGDVSTEMHQLGLLADGWAPDQHSLV